MTALAITDKNGNAVSMDLNAVGGNQAGTVVLADQGGNKFTLAPGLVALPVQSEGIKTGYMYAILGFTPVATPTDIIEIQGSATKTVRIRRVWMGGGATAAANMPITGLRRSAADTTALVRTAVAAFVPDTAYAAATAAVSSIGTANPGSLGTQVGGIAAAGRIQLPALATGLGASPLIWDFDINAVVLRGVSQFFYLNMGGTAVPGGGVFDFVIWTTEDAS
jgi:hypothetical protein